MNRRSNRRLVFAIAAGAGILGGMHLINGVRDPAKSFPLDTLVDDAGEWRQANRAIAVSAVGLALTGLIELAIALFSGSVALLGDALHNLSDVSTSALVFVGFRASRRLPTERYPYGYERAEDLAGIGVALVIWGSALPRRLRGDRRYRSPAARRRRPRDHHDRRNHRYRVPGVQYAHARARWTGRTLRVEVEGFLEPDAPLLAADQIGRSVAAALAAQIPDMHSFTWTARAA
jgi:divalent metal cation (Fe/Co/Zn/Cd) transporter